MSVECRAIRDDEYAQYVLVDQQVFAFRRKPERGDSWSRGDLDRAFAAYVDGAMVAIGRNYSFELTVPSGAMVPAAAVSWIATLPTHSRRGLLTEIMAALHDDARRRGEPVAMLTASESGIYGRFGYGVATWRCGYSIEPRYGAFARPFVDSGGIRLVEEEEAHAAFPPLWEQVRPTRAGMVSRPDFWWPEVWWQEEAEGGAARFWVVHETDGQIDGYLDYSVDNEWGTGLSQRRLTIDDLQATTPLAEAALWRYALDFDLVAKVRAHNRPVDESLRWWLADPRRLVTDYVNDQLWIRLLDVTAALAARRYAIEASIVLEVIEVDGSVARYRLDGGLSAAACVATDEAPDLTLGIAALGAAYLGGTRFSEQAAAGLITEHSPGTLARADLMFTSVPRPATMSWF